MVARTLLTTGCILESADRQPTTFETNLARGESEAVDIVMLSGSTHDVIVRVPLDEETLFERTTTVSTTFRERVSYAPKTVDIHSLTAVFERGGKRIDTRYLKMFVRDG